MHRRGYVAIPLVCVVGEAPLLSLEDRMARDVREHQMALLQSHTGRLLKIKM